jgi:glycosyltransferase involved in cell wall biosynthesis
VPERFCIIVPHFEHVDALEAYLPALLGCSLPVLVVDDGSAAPAREALRSVLARHPAVQLIERPVNGGKGAAMLTGMRAALERGFSHGIGVDADGQHDAGDVVRLQRAAAEHPHSIISGQPTFGPDIPPSRRYGRMITNGLARLESGSAAMRDVMCGLRCYPLAVVAALCGSYRVRHRMDFDTEILVRAAWRGVPVRYVETRVRYPEGGVSHFRLFRDNVDMTLMHLRLLIGALFRSPLWIALWLKGSRRRAGPECGKRQ